MGGPLHLREAFNVDDAMARDRLVRRLRKIRAGAVLDKATYEQWNREHPNEKPIDTRFWDHIIEWCDGKRANPVTLEDLEAISEARHGR